MEVIRGTLPRWAKGNGYGRGHGYGYGHGAGHGYGDGYGAGHGAGSGAGYGYGHGHGPSYGYGAGSDSGSGSSSCIHDDVVSCVPHCVAVTADILRAAKACWEGVELFIATFPAGATWPRDRQRAIDAGLDVSWAEGSLLPPVIPRRGA